jgi:hypothetical protein
MADVVFVLCALTSLVCAVLLWRGYLHSRARLLFWSALCFACLVLNNVLLIIDVRVVPLTDLTVWRTLPAVIGVALLLYGLVFETRS